MTSFAIPFSLSRTLFSLSSLSLSVLSNPGLLSPVAKSFDSPAFLFSFLLSGLSVSHSLFVRPKITSLSFWGFTTWS